MRLRSLFRTILRRRSSPLAGGVGMGEGSERLGGRRVCFVVIALLTMVSLTCNSLPVIEVRWPGEPSEENPFPEIGGEESGPFIDEGDGFVLPLETQVGQSRIQPFPLDTVVKTDGWEIQVLEVLKGTEAWRRIHAANPNNQPPPEGWTYLMVKLHVRRSGSDHLEYILSLGVTGDRGILYRSPAIVEPVPQFRTVLYGGQTLEGWEAFLVPADEGNLLLSFKGLDDMEDAPQYIALDEGASIAVDLGLLDIQSTAFGTSVDTAVALGDQVVTEDWEVVVDKVVWGETAWAQLLEANQFNKPPREGMVYGLVGVRARYIDILEGPAYINKSFFRVLDSAGTSYTLPAVVAPDPDLTAHLFPGGESQGWIPVEVPQEQTSVVLVFTPSWRLEDYQTRYFLLKP